MIRSHRASGPQFCRKMEESQIRIGRHCNPPKFLSSVTFLDNERVGPRHSILTRRSSASRRVRIEGPQLADRCPHPAVIDELIDRHGILDEVLRFVEIPVLLEALDTELAIWIDEMRDN